MMARLPDYMTVANQRRVGDTLVVDIHVDTAALERAFSRMAEAIQDMGHQLRRSLARWGHAQAQRREVWVAGLEGRYYVRGGLDSRYQDPLDRDILVLQLLRGRELGACKLTPKERGLVAAAFLTGWVTGQGKDFGECLCWMTPPEMWTTHYGAVEPGSTMEWNPACGVHGA